MYARKLAVIGLAAAAAVVAGGGLLRFASVHGREVNWVPVHLPYPGTGLTVADTFRLDYGGPFKLQIITPATIAEQDAGNRERPPVNTLLRFELKGPDGFRLARTITGVDLGAWSGALNMFTAEEVFDVPSAGTYDITLHDAGQGELFQERGAMVQLVRVASVGPQMLDAIAELLGYVCLLISAVLIAVVAIAGARGGR